MNWNWLLALLLAVLVAVALLARWHRSRPIECRCGHLPASHEHWRQGSDCGACGSEECKHYRRARRRQPEPPVDPAAVCRDQEAIEAIRAGDREHALRLVDEEFVDLITALVALGRAS